MIGSVICLLILDRKKEVTNIRPAVSITNGKINDRSIVFCTAFRTPAVFSSIIYFGSMTANVYCIGSGLE